MSLNGRESLKALAFLLLTFGHSTDGQLSMDEMRALADRLKARAPEAELDELAEVIKAAVSEYKTLPSTADKLARARQYTDALRQAASGQDVQDVLADLREVASADGTISAEEQKFIDDVAATLLV